MEELVVKLKLDNFEGPFDLLLSLIDKKKLKIEELRISQIIDEYLSIVNEADSENYDLKSEFAATTAELLAIKAQTILHNNEEQEEEKKFKQRLEDYRVFKELSDKLAKMENEYNVSYSRGEGRKIMKRPPKEYNVGNLQPLDLFKVYSAKLEEKKDDFLDIVFEKEYSLNAEAEKLFYAIGTTQRSFDWIFDRAESKMHMIYLFLSILELYKDGYIIITKDSLTATSKEWVPLNIQEDNIIQASLEPDASKKSPSKNSKKNSPKKSDRKEDKSNNKKNNTDKNSKNNNKDKENKKSITKNNSKKKKK